eukprot:CAMPEP_0201564796 /NCGR_PEP_ID=MMETSP0190_2-20130828/3378_1 /ASSEMBLY_ACC=CAM_ASM_000263 /TAXON_ID=37353 /ORGANISM="Rosalina sp." /LENGTH=281 /DNA_ID=CAMNT_0047981455 /DNA_START=80 /DNA_END=925 /DNA_ORIENTATION=+
MASLIATLSLLKIVQSVQITGWVYADNWFELYFNGEKVGTDTISYIPHNAMYINFTAPDSGLYSFAFWAQDYANDSTGLEQRMDGTGITWTGDWCMGDGGILMHLSDGTVTSSDWKCTVVMEGPLETACQDECIDLDVMSPSQCTVQYNEYPSCWNETICSSEDSWLSATEYTIDDVGMGRTPDSSSFDYPNVCSGLDATSTEEIYQNEGCDPRDKDWGDAVPIWTSDLDLDNRIICRYSYNVVYGSTPAPDTTETTTEDNASNQLATFMTLVMVFIGMFI